MTLSDASEHFDQNCGNCLGGVARDSSKLAPQALPIDSAELVQNDLTLFPLKAHLYPGGIRTDDSGHRSDHDRPQMLVHLVRRDHQAGAGFWDFNALCRIQGNHPHFVALWGTAYQRHSLRSNSPGSEASIRRSSCSDGPAARNASCHPPRGSLFREMTRQLFSTRNSTVPSSPHCSINGFGIRTPRELPMRTSSALIVVITL